MTELTKLNQVRHGGDLTKAIEIYGGEKSDWLDLSTGISPWAYPIPRITEELWRTLPEPSTDLEKVAAEYYSCNQSDIAVLPGSQLAIRLLPTLIERPQTVAIPWRGYQEHKQAWQLAGHSTVFYKTIDELLQLVHTKQVYNAVLINPNNPTGELANAKQIEQISNEILGLLVVDEAFIDTTPNLSTVNRNLAPNILIFRSIGKFFGLAGARVGVAISLHPINRALQRLFTPWSVSAPSQYIAQIALADLDWQQQQRERILKQSKEVELGMQAFTNCFKEHSIKVKTCGLFTTLFAKDIFIEDLHTQLAKQKIWTRVGDKAQGNNWLRFSLPGDSLERFQCQIESALRRFID